MYTVYGICCGLQQQQLRSVAVNATPYTVDRQSHTVMDLSFHVQGSWFRGWSVPMAALLDAYCCIAQRCRIKCLLSSTMLLPLWKQCSVAVCLFVLQLGTCTSRMTYHDALCTLKTPVSSIGFNFCSDGLAQYCLLVLQSAYTVS